MEYLSFLKFSQFINDLLFFLEVGLCFKWKWLQDPADIMFRSTAERKTFVRRFLQKILQLLEAISIIFYHSCHISFVSSCSFFTVASTLYFIGSQKMYMASFLAFLASLLGIWSMLMPVPTQNENLLFNKIREISDCIICSFGFFFSSILLLFAEPGCLSTWKMFQIILLTAFQSCSGPFGILRSFCFA